MQHRHLQRRQRPTRVADTYERSPIAAQALYKSENPTTEIGLDGHVAIKKEGQGGILLTCRGRGGAGILQRAYGDFRCCACLVLAALAQPLIYANLSESELFLSTPSVCMTSPAK